MKEAAYQDTVPFYEQLENKVMATPRAMAIITATAQLTYREVFEHANQIAHVLLAAGVVPNQLVAVFTDKGWEGIVASLGILGSGAAFLPIDANWPVQRIQTVLQQGNVQHVLTQAHLKPQLTSGGARHDYQVWSVDDTTIWTDIPRTAPVTVDRQQDDIAYVIFTSGTTGIPKGVTITHRNVMNTICDINERFEVSHTDRMLGLAALSFDLAIYDMLGLLLAGGALVLPDASLLKEPAHWLALIDTHHITLWNSVPQQMQMLVDYMDIISTAGIPMQHSLSSLRLILLSGDRIPLSLPKRIKQHTDNAQLISLGGATECSIWSVLFPIDEIDSRWTRIPYGLPMRHQIAYILDEALTLCETGQTGLLYLGGIGVAKGYWADRKQTLARFIFHPKTGERLYCTGDLARWTSEGWIDFIGREDTQIKRSGYRIELGEIEASLETHPSVKNCAVVAYSAESATQLVAYVVPSEVAYHPSHSSSSMAHWRTIYDHVYQHAQGEHADPLLNTAGWISSYTHQPFSRGEMREWVMSTVTRLLSLEPVHVLEIGCGSGLLLGRLAPHCQTYLATDISPVAIAKIEQLKEHHPNLAHVSTSVRSADDFSGWEDLQVDLVVINSVIQHFPSGDYLMKVLQHATTLLSPSGVLFIGDVRHVGLLEAFHATVYQHHSQQPLTRAKLAAYVKHQLLEEEELCVAPHFFHTLNQQHSALRGVNILIKAGQHINEMNQFRYDVILHREGPALTKEMLRFHTAAYHRGEACESFSQRAPLRVAPTCEDTCDVWLFSDLPNARLVKARSLVSWMQGDTCTPLPPAEGIDPAQFTRQVRRAGWDCVLIVHPEDPFLFQAYVCHPATYLTLLQHLHPEIHLPKHPGLTSVNRPELLTLRQTLVPALRAHLTAHLPGYMLPQEIRLIAYLPLSTNGKVDKHALPSPEKHALKLLPLTMLPRSAREEALGAIFREVLMQDALDIDADFFEYGGTSLKAVACMTRFNTQYGTQYPVSMLFSHPTVRTLATAMCVNQRKGGYQPLLKFNTAGSRVPLFLVHSTRGSAEAYINLLSHVDAEQPLYVFESYNLYHQECITSLDALAAQYLHDMQRICPAGPYHLGGWSLGGLIAYEMAQQLTQVGETVAIVYLLDTPLFNQFERKKFTSGSMKVLEHDPYYQTLPLERRASVKQAESIYTQAMLRYQPKPYEGEVILFKANELWTFLDTSRSQWSWITKAFVKHACTKKHNGWSDYAKRLEVIPVPGDHLSMMKTPHVSELAQKIQADSVRRSDTRQEPDPVQAHFDPVFHVPPAKQDTIMLPKIWTGCEERV